MSKQAYGWLIDVTERGGRCIARYHVAVPSKQDAIIAVRRRVRDAADTTIVAVRALSRHAVYNQLRLKRGDIAQVHD